MTSAYRGPIEAVILDWAGTTMDFGCMAPAVVFIKVFERAGVPITVEEARAPMGTHKWVHLQHITRIPSVRDRWIEAHGRPPNDVDVERMFADFVPLQLACLSDYSTLIPGTLETVAECRRRGYKIGSTTGYMAEMTEINLADAKRQGYEPDATVSASQVPDGRPYPYMCLKNAIDLGVKSVRSCVKVDDTLPGIAEGLNAGMWTVGLAVSGNEVGLPATEWAALDEDEKAKLRETAYRRMTEACAHYVADTIADLIPCLDDIEARLARGETP